MWIYIYLKIFFEKIRSKTSGEKRLINFLKSSPETLYGLIAWTEEAGDKLPILPCIHLSTYNSFSPHFPPHYLFFHNRSPPQFFLLIHKILIPLFLPYKFFVYFSPLLSFPHFYLSLLPYLLLTSPLLLPPSPTHLSPTQHIALPPFYSLPLLTAPPPPSHFPLPE